MVQINFDATNVEPDTGFENVPAGWYNVAIDESDLKPTRDGAGAYLQLRFDILDGQYKGRKLFARLNIRNANAQTVEIAYKQLSAIGHAVGILQIGDTTMLHGRPLKVKVKVRKDTSGQYEDSNDISMYKPISYVPEGGGGQSPAQQNGGGFTPPPQNNGGGFTPPPQQQAPQTQFPPQTQQPPMQQQPPQFQQPPAQQQPLQFQQPPQQQQPPQFQPAPQEQQQQPPQFQPAPQEQQQQPQQTWSPPQNGGEQPWSQPPQQQQPAQQQPPQQQQPQQAQQAAQHPAQQANPPWAQ